MSLSFEVTVGDSTWCLPQDATMIYDFAYDAQGILPVREREEAHP